MLPLLDAGSDLHLVKINGRDEAPNWAIFSSSLSSSSSSRSASFAPPAAGEREREAVVPSRLPDRCGADLHLMSKSAFFGGDEGGGAKTLDSSFSSSTAAIEACFAFASPASSSLVGLKLKLKSLLLECSKTWGTFLWW